MQDLAREHVKGQELGKRRHLEKRLFLTTLSAFHHSLVLPLLLYCLFNNLTTNMVFKSVEKALLLEEVFQGSCCFICPLPIILYTFLDSHILLSKYLLNK